MKKRIGTKIMKMSELVRRTSVRKATIHFYINQGLYDDKSVGDISAMGLMAAIELVKDKETKEQIGILPMESPRRIEELMWEKGIYARAIPNESIALAPPFIVSEQEIATVVDALDSSIAQMEREIL